MKAFLCPHFDCELHSESNSETLHYSSHKTQQSALSASTQLLSAFRVQLPPWEPEASTQKQSIPQAKIHTGFKESSDKQLLKAFEKITPKKDHYWKECYGKMLVIVKMTIGIYSYTLSNDI